MTIKISAEAIKGLTGIELAARIVGGPSALARLFGATPQAIYSWQTRGVPECYFEDLARLTGLPKNSFKYARDPKTKEVFLVKTRRMFTLPSRIKVEIEGGRAVEELLSGASE